MNTDLEGGGTEEGVLALDFEAWAGLSARLLKLGQEERLDVLDERGMDVADWRRCDKHYSLALATDVAEGRMDRAKSYGVQCAAELDRRKREAAPAPDEPGARHERGPVEAETKRELAALSGVAAPILEAASFQKETAPAAAASGSAPSSFAGTMDAADFPSFLKSPAAALPFVRGSVPDLASSARAPRGPAPDAGGTVELGTDLASPPRPPLPFAQQSAGPAFPRLPLQGYASLCAELAVFPERAAEALRKYGIKDEAARVALDADWRIRLSEHADTREAWQQLCAQYETYLRQQPT